MGLHFWRQVLILEIVSSTSEGRREALLQSRVLDPVRGTRVFYAPVRISAAHCSAEIAWAGAIDSCEAIPVRRRCTAA